MSINFEKPVSPEILARIRKIFVNRLVASDEQTVLVDAGAFRSADMSDIARMAKQPVTLALHGDGEVVTMKDGTTYRVTPRGWRKVESGEDAP